MESWRGWAASGLRTTSLSTLDSNIKGRLCVRRPFSTADSDPAPVLNLLRRCLGQAALDSWAAGQIASLSPVSYRDP